MKKHKADFWWTGALSQLWVDFKHGAKKLYQQK